VVSKGLPLERTGGELGAQGRGPEGERGILTDENLSLLGEWGESVDSKKREKDGTRRRDGGKSHNERMHALWRKKGRKGSWAASYVLEVSKVTEG